LKEETGISELQLKEAYQNDNIFIGNATAVDRVRNAKGKRESGVQGAWARKSD